MDQTTTSIEHAASPHPNRAHDSAPLPLLPRLIDDVLLAILEELAQPEFTDDGYKLRQQTLRNVCLASRRLRVLAQPLLWRQVVVSADEQMDQLHQMGSLGKKTRVFKVSGGLGCNLGDVLSVGAATLPNVEDFTLVASRSSSMNLSWPQAYTNLRRLDLVNVQSIAPYLDHAPPPPRLEVLVLWRCAVVPVDAAQWLTSASLPRLKTLVVGLSSFTLATALAPCVAKQLEFIQVDKLSRDSHDQWASTLSPAVVVVNPDFRGFLPRHSMYGFYQALDRRARRQMIQPFKSHVGKEPRADADAGTVLLLPSQVLDAVQDDPASSVDHDKDVKAWHELEALCRQRGRRVIWYDEQELRASREFIPLEFVRHLREVKARGLVASASSSSR
ncbi:hypothetical protein JCM8208_004354 [Rhodotorula glutinis]